MRYQLIKLFPSHNHKYLNDAKSLKNCFFICSAFFKPKSQAGGGEILLKFSLTSLEDLFKQPRKKNNNNPLDYTVIFFGPLAL